QRSRVADGLCLWCPHQSAKPIVLPPIAGLSTTLCRAHKEHLSRHGHPLKPSYAGSEIAPLENLARRWLRRAAKKAPTAHVSNVLLRVRTLLNDREECGATLPTVPEDRARAIMARLYAKYCGERWEGVRTRWPRKLSLDQLALEVAAMGLAIELAHALHPAPCSDPRYVETQIGKLLFRRSGGWLRRSIREDDSKTEYMLQ